MYMPNSIATEDRHKDLNEVMECLNIPTNVQPVADLIEAALEAYDEIMSSR